MPVIVKYDSGFDTKLFFQDQLEARINAKGPATYNSVLATCVFTDGTTCPMKFRFPGDKRKIVRLETVPWTSADKNLRENLRNCKETRCYCQCRCR